MLPWSDRCFMVTKTAISVLVSVSVKILSVTYLAVVRSRSIFFAMGAGPAAVMTISTPCA
jgi:hypothetical protein